MALVHPQIVIQNPPNVHANMPIYNPPCTVFQMFTAMLHRIIRSIDGIEDNISFILILSSIFLTFGVFIIICTLFVQYCHQWYIKRQKALKAIAKSNSNAASASTAIAKNDNVSSNPTIVNNYNCPQAQATTINRRSTRHLPLTAGALNAAVGPAAINN